MNDVAAVIRPPLHDMDIQCGHNRSQVINEYVTSEKMTLK
jgi:hypothetical protein